MSLHPLPYREIKRKLEAAGFAIISQRGSHVKFIKQTSAGLYTVIVPNHQEVALVCFNDSISIVARKSSV